MDGMTYDKPCQNCKRICMEFNARFLSPKAYEEWSVRMDNCIEKAAAEKALLEEKRKQELELQKRVAEQREKEKYLSHRPLKKIGKRISRMHRRYG